MSAREMMSRALPALCIAMLLVPAAHAQRADTSDARRWGLEADLVQPFIPEVNIITIKATRTITGVPSAAHGDLMLGVFVRPNITHDVVTRISEHMGSIGYRQYIRGGLHAEAQYLAGYVWGTRNLVDRKDYEGFVHFAEANVGYRIPLGRAAGRRLYATPQIGFLQGLNDELVIGPRNGKADAFVTGKLLVGFSF
jgi:hypothetical protein